ncbi:hypothetical protein B566_EDAN001412 [Ephemera danica]|nr:hypothetical protein B566_EDAN001412 [Ephemera danica]
MLPNLIAAKMALSTINRKLMQNVIKSSGCFLIRPNQFRCYAPVARKRFYRRSSILEAGSGYWEVTLDQRRVKTPGGQVLRVENESLALALSNEWDIQRDSINMSTMHLHGLCCTAMDNPNHLTKLDIANSIINFLETDTVLYLSEEWLPVVDWFRKTMDLEITPTNTMSLPVVTSAARESLMRYLMSHSFIALHGFSFAVEALKSVILAIACMQRHLPVEKVVLLARLEEEFQSGRWGRVEWSHDLAQEDIQSRVSAATLLVHLTSSSANLKSK